MLTNRTSLLTFAAIAALALAATGAEAGFICQRGMGGFAKAYNPVPQPRITSKVPNVRPKDDEQYAKAASRKPPAAAPAKPTIVVGAAKPATSVEVTDVSAVNAAKPASVANAAVSTPTATATKACLTKEYLDTGAIRFRDTCTKEWAINSTNVNTKASKVGQGCLTKENSQNGVVMFKDVCTGEWAMNTTEQLALAEAQ